MSTVTEWSLQEAQTTEAASSHSVMLPPRPLFGDQRSIPPPGPAHLTTSFKFGPNEKDRVVRNERYECTDWLIDQIHLIALNNPNNGNMRGLRGADLLCYRQARQAGFVTTFRALLASHAQVYSSLSSIYRNPFPLRILSVLFIVKTILQWLWMQRERDYSNHGIHSSMDLLWIMFQSTHSIMLTSILIITG